MAWARMEAVEIEMSGQSKETFFFFSFCDNTVRYVGS